MRSGRKSIGKRARYIESLEARRLLSAGQLDTSFGTGGKVVVDFHGTSVEANAVATQSDGKTVIVGWGDAMTVVRLNVDGSLDKTFGPAHTGMVSTQVGNQGAENGAYAVAVQSNGKILVAGTDNIVAEESSAVDSEMYVVRYNTDGTLDKTFNGSGISGIDFGFLTISKATTMTLQSDGKIVVAGFENDRFNATTRDIGVARLNSNGSIDKSFGDNGTMTVGFGDDSDAHAITVDDNYNATVNPTFGTITVVGGTDGKFAIARLTSSGKLDDRFSGDGMLTTSIPGQTDDTATGVIAQPGGKLVISGSTGNSGQSHLFSIVRFNSDGTIDKSFGVNKTGWNSVGFGGDDRAESMVVAPNNRLIVGGSAGSNMAIAAFSTNGVLDQTFGTSGKVTTNFGGSSSANGLAYYGGRLVAAGGGKFDTARYFDIIPNVSITSTDDAAGEAKTIKRVGKFVELVPNTANLIVSRDQSLPYATRVYFTISGTATLPNVVHIKFKNNDYTLSGMTISPLPATNTTGYVDIPAGQTSVTVTMTAVDDATREPTELAKFALQSNSNYATFGPSSETLSILDNDSTNIVDSADAYVQDGSSANTNFGATTPLAVKKSGTSGLTRQAYFKFNLAGVTSIDTVTLSLFGELNNTTNTNLESDLYSVATTSWTETGITNNNKPAAGTKLGSITVLNTTPQTYTIDVTAYVKTQLAAGHTTVSFVLKNPNNSGSAFLINSREASSSQPTLTIT